MICKRVSFVNNETSTFWIDQKRIALFLKGDTNIRYLLQNKNHIWDEWAFERYIKSPDYNGPDMTDFGHRCLTDPEFNEEYKKQSKLFLREDPNR